MRRPVLLVLALLAVAKISYADSVTITSGNAVVGFGAPLVVTTLAGDGFSAVISWDLGTVTSQQLCSGAGCAPGTVLSLNTMVFSTNVNVPPAENAARGPATIDGVSYPFLAYRGELSFIGPLATLPPPSEAMEPGPAAFFSGPFAMSGTLEAFQILGVRDAVLIATEQLSGQGTASAAMLLNPRSNTYSFGTLRYDFASAPPIPEPTSLTLLATAIGAAGLWSRSRRLSGLFGAGRRTHP